MPRRTVHGVDAESSAVGPIITGAFLLAFIVEALLPRETLPRIRGWRFLGILFFIVSAAINVFLPLLIAGEWVAKHSLLPGMKLGVAGGFAVGFVAWSFAFAHPFDMIAQTFLQIGLLIGVLGLHPAAAALAQHRTSAPHAGWNESCSGPKPTSGTMSSGNTTATAATGRCGTSC
jgi:hypothetical protein